MDWLIRNWLELAFIIPAIGFPLILIAAATAKARGAEKRRGNRE